MKISLPPQNSYFGERGQAVSRAGTVWREGVTWEQVSWLHPWAYQVGPLETGTPGAPESGWPMGWVPSSMCSCDLRL